MMAASELLRQVGRWSAPGAEKVPGGGGDSRPPPPPVAADRRGGPAPSPEAVGRLLVEAAGAHEQAGVSDPALAGLLDVLSGVWGASPRWTRRLALLAYRRQPAAPVWQGWR